MIRICHIFVLVIAFSALITASCSIGGQPDPSVALKESIPVADLIAQADELYKQRADLEKLRDGIALLKRARNADNRNFEANWKLAKFSYYLGKYTTDDKESEKALKDGSEAGEMASIVEQNKPHGYFWHGACLGEDARRSPLTKGITSVAKIKELMNKVIGIDPTYQNGSVYDALSQVELKSALVGGDPQKAVEYAEKALEIEKTNSFIYLHLAEAYLATHQQEKAKKHLDYLLKKGPHPDYVPEYADAKAQAEKLLRTRF